MPIAGVEQPDCIFVSDTLRLRKYDGVYDFALAWYQDPETLRLVDGKTEPYDLERLGRMYTYLDGQGELYFIERRCGEAFVPIGDVTFWQEDMPIVIGHAAERGRGTGRRVVLALIARARELGYTELFIGEIYAFNTASQRLFERCGFVRCAQTESGYRYRLAL